MADKTPRSNVVRAVTQSANAAQLARKRKVTWSITEIDQELAWRRWFPDVTHDWSQQTPPDVAAVLHAAFVSFCEDNLHIRFPGKGKIPLVLRPAQRDVVLDWITHRKTVCLKARQIGFSTLVAAYTLWLAFGWGDRQIIMLSKTERESVKLLGKARYNYKWLPEWVRLRGPELLDKTRQVMTFDNDSVVESLPSTQDAVRGEAVFLIVVDEWAFLGNPDEAWASIEPVADIGGRVIGISTAKGEGNFFHKLWLGSQGGTNGFHGVFHPWWAVTDRTQEWYDDKKLNLPEWQLHQEYPGDPDEAFVGSGNAVFNLENIKRFTVVSGETYTIQGNTKRSVVLFESGPLTIWEAPNDEDRHTYVVGADPAQGLEHGDATCAWVVCVNTNRLVAVWYGKVDPDIFGENILPAIGWFYRDALIVPEINNHGLTVLTALRRVKYKWLYKRRTFTKRMDRPLESMGWLTTATSKPLMVDELQSFLREVENVPDGTTIHELRTFTRDEKGRMGGSPHDDTVMALAIAVQGLKYARTERPLLETSAEKVKGSYSWWESKLDGRKRGSGRLTPVA